MKKGLPYSIIVTFLFTISFTVSALDFESTDKLHLLGRYDEEQSLLLSSYDASSPDPALLWRVGRVFFERAERISDDDKDKKIAIYDRALTFLKPYLDISYGTKRDRALIVHWYTANYGSKASTKGTLEALSVVPDLFELTDKALAIDPAFSDPYFVKAKIDDRLPGFAGGDKFRMGENLARALLYNSTDITVHVDGAKALYKRGWSVDKKKDLAEKKGRSDGTPADKSDREYAVILLQRAIKLYTEKELPTARDKEKYAEAIKLLKKYK